jgi:malate dehydrogenase (quinone)
MSGSPLDWISTFNPSNVLPMMAMGLQNLDLVTYLVKEVFASKDAQLAALRQFVPDAKPEDWTMVWAGQRIQIVKPDPKLIGKLEFGTEVLASKDGTIVGLLGASPGASVSPHIAIEVRV